MKEIKFRAISKHDFKYIKKGQKGFMFYQQVIKDKEDISELWFVMENNPDFRYRFDDVLLDDDWIKMQFSGLHDTRDKEIYEGDIIKLPNTHICVIAWKNAQLLPVAIKKRWGIKKYEHWIARNAEILGNIYENSELIKRR